MKRSILSAALLLSLAAPALSAPIVRVGGFQSPMFVRQATNITRKQAIQIAIQAVGGGQATRVHRDDFHDRPTFQVTVQNSPFEYEVDVDRQSGQVLRIQKHREG